MALPVRQARLVLLALVVRLDPLAQAAAPAQPERQARTGFRPPSSARPARFPESSSPSFGFQAERPRIEIFKQAIP
jgi:hypothetical protein